MKPVRTRTKSFRVNWSSSSPRNVAPKATKEEFSRKSYIVERIVDNRTKAGQVCAHNPSVLNSICLTILLNIIAQKQYFLKWKGFPSADNTWEPVSSLVPNCSSLIEEYELSQRRKADVSVAADESTRGLRESSSESEDLTPMEIVGTFCVVLFGS